MNPGCHIIGWAPDYAADFERLNRRWLESLFRVEPVDAKVLRDPAAEIIEPGGHILFASTDQAMIVGTVALKPAGVEGVELTKMAVEPDFQGAGIGRLLLDAAIRYWRRHYDSPLFLESHSSLAPALSLYERAGFRRCERPSPSDYERADIYMVYGQAGDDPRVLAKQAAQSLRPRPQ